MPSQEYYSNAISTISTQNGRKFRHTTREVIPIDTILYIMNIE